MNISNLEINNTLRRMAWERAKGELKSMLQTYFDGDSDKYNQLETVIESFIYEVEDNGWEE